MVKRKTISVWSIFWYRIEMMCLIALLIDPWLNKVVEQNRNGNFVKQSKFLFPSEDYRKYRHSSYNCKEESRKNIFLLYIYSESESESDRMFFQFSSWQLQPKCRYFWKSSDGNRNFDSCTKFWFRLCSTPISCGIVDRARGFVAIVRGERA